MKRGWFFYLAAFLLVIPFSAAECCTLSLETKESCNGNLLHQGKCTGNEAFLLGFDPIYKKYSVLKSFEDGNEFLKIAETKLYANTHEKTITALSGQEKLTLKIGNKSLLFNDLEVNSSGFLTRYGTRMFATGEIEIPYERINATIDFTVLNDKVSFSKLPGNKTDVLLTHADINSLKETTYKYKNNSNLARERLSFNGLYLDSGSYFSDKPEPFIEAERVSYSMEFLNEVDLSGLSSTSPFTITLLDKKAEIYEVDPPDRMLIGFDGKIQFRDDGDFYDNLWRWTVSAYSQKLVIGFDAKKVKSVAGCIQLPLGFAKACPKSINASELFVLNTTIQVLNVNNKTVSVIEINSNKLVSGNFSTQTRRMFLADGEAYKNLVLETTKEAERPTEELALEEIIPEEGAMAANESEKPMEEKPKAINLKIMKIVLYSLLVLLIVLLSFRLKKVLSNPNKNEQ